MRAFDAAGKPIAAMSHAALLQVSCGLAAGRTLTADSDPPQQAPSELPDQSPRWLAAPSLGAMLSLAIVGVGVVAANAACAGAKPAKRRPCSLRPRPVRTAEIRPRTAVTRFWSRHRAS